MIDPYGRWIPDFPGQQPYQDPAYMRMANQQQHQQQQPAHMQQSAQPPIQNGGFISVRSIEEVEAWPIAPGNSITFHISTNPPLIAEKTRGFSQLENAVTKYYDLHERQINQTPLAQPAPAFNPADFVTKADLQVVAGEIETVKAQLSDLTAPKRPAAKPKKEGEE